MRRHLKNLGLGLIVLVVLVIILEIAFRLIAGSPGPSRGQAIAERGEGEMEYHEDGKDQKDLHDGFMTHHIAPKAF